VCPRRALAPGDTSDPIDFRDPNGNAAVLVVQRAPTDPTLPPFDEVKEQATERAYVEAMELQRKLWLKELRRGVFIDVRL
jgi:hypothetical protein